MDQLVLWHRWIPSADLPSHQVERFCSAVRTAAARAGGTELAAVGGTLAFGFDALELPTPLLFALRSIAEAEGQDPPVLGSWGAALGTIEGEASPCAATLARAQALANHGIAGELILDDSAREGASNTLLFARRISAPGGISGTAVDRAFPRRSDCRAHLEHLRPIVFPASAPAPLARIREVAAGEGMQWLVIRGRIGSGTEEWVRALELDLAPPLVLRVHAVPGVLEPLGSLRLALLRKWGDPDGVYGAIGAGAAAETLRQIADGRAVSRTD
ncbi:MAG: hypothetical protein KC416_09270, partial [Myxococcales bacterium]|nr:hypothetical protein [Myxococcales bacterium]